MRADDAWFDKESEYGGGEVDDMAILRVKREEEFAPVKNADSAGVDCPSTARKLYEDFHHLK